MGTGLLSLGSLPQLIHWSQRRDDPPIKHLDLALGMLAMALVSKNIEFRSICKLYLIILVHLAIVSYIDRISENILFKVCSKNLMR